MAKRKTISRALRFEVFKRDSFTCQYCGDSAPDVVLEVDYIKPVADGGENDIMNLITACFDCNRGKGKKKLSDNTTVKKQADQLKALNLKREQLEMMVKWKQELIGLEDEEVNHVEALLEKHTGFVYSETGRKNAKKLIKKYGFSDVYDAAQTSIDQYYKQGDRESVTTTFDKIGAILHIRETQRKEPYMKDIYYICGILKNRLSYFDRNKAIWQLKDVCKRGADTERLIDIAKNARNWSGFMSDIWDEVD